jgi:hypothetical protein
MTRSPRARIRSFHGRFHGAPIFCCKTTPFSETPRESVWLRSAPKNTLCNVLKKLRKYFSLNYKSAALLAGARVEKHERCARAERTLYFLAGGNALISSILAP